MISKQWPKTGQFIDARDQDGKWLVAIVVNRTQNQVKIRFDGLNKSDETIQIVSQSQNDNPRLQQFRKYTKGLTGNKKSNIGRQHWKFSHEDIDNRLKKLEDFTMNIKLKKSYQLIQFLRGQNYLYIDFLLNTTFNSLNDISKAQAYFFKHMVLARQYINLMFSRGVIRQQNKPQRQSQQQIDWWNIFFKCFYEISQSLFHFCVKYQKLNGFIARNGNLSKPHSFIQQYQNQIINQLQQNGLFQTITQFIEYIFQYIQNQQQQLLQFQYQSEINLTFLYHLFQLMFVIEKNLKILKDNHLDQMIQKISAIYTQSINSIQFEDTQIFDRQLQDLIKLVKSLYIRTCRYKVRQLEELRIQYAGYLLTSSNGENKIKGLNRLKEYSEDLVQYYAIDNNSDIKVNRQRFIQLYKKSSWLNSLINAQQNFDFYKKSLELFKNIYQNQGIKINEISSLWKIGLIKSGAYIRCLFNHWLQITRFLTQQDSYIFLDILGKYFIQYDDIRSCSNFAQYYFQQTYSLLKKMIIFNKQYEYSNKQYLRQFKKRLQVMAFRGGQLLYNCNDNSKRQQFIQIYTKIIIHSTNGRILITQIFKYACNINHFQISYHILFVIFSKYQYRHYLPDHFVFLIYDIFTQCSLNQDQTHGIFQLLNNMLKLVSQQPKQYYTKQHFIKWWQYFHHNGNNKKSIFYKWLLPNQNLYSYSSYNKSINFYLSQQLKQFIVQYILNYQQYYQIDIDDKQISIIIQLFFIYNFQKNNLQGYCQQNQKYLIKNIQLYKQDLLWIIFEKCQDYQIIQILNNIFISIYFHYSSSIPQYLRKTRIDTLIQKLTNYLTQALQTFNTFVIRNTLQLMKKIISLVKQDKITQYQSGKTYIISVQAKYQNQSIKFEIKTEDTVKNIKIRLSSHLGIKAIDLQLLNDGNELGYEWYDIRLLNQQQPQLSVTKLQNSLGRYILSQISHTQQILFKILQKQINIQQVFDILDELQLGKQKNWFLNKINQILQKNQHFNLQLIHYYLLLIKIYNKNINDHIFLNHSFNNHHFNQLISTLTTPIILGSHQLLLFHHLILFLIKIYKKGLLMDKRQSIANNCLNLIIKIYLFVNENKTDAYIRQQLNHIIRNSFYLIQQHTTQNKILLFLLTHQNIQKLINILFFSNEYLQQSKYEILQKLKIYLLNYKNQQHIISIQQKLIYIFYNYYIKFNQYFKSGKFKYYHKIKNQFYNIFIKVLNVISLQVLSKYILQNQQKYSILTMAINLLNHFKYSKQLRQMPSKKIIIHGNFTIIKLILEKYPQLKTFSIIKFILQKCLGITNQIRQSSAICNTPNTIKIAFETLHQIIGNNPSVEILGSIMKILKDCQNSTYWRINNKWSVNIHPELKQRYRGLVNPGCICYMNSLLQQLFMIEQFTNGILSINEKNKNIKQQQISILPGLKQLFLRLQYSQQNTVHPLNFSKTIKTIDKKPMIKINQQMDIDQFSSILFDKIQKQLQIIQNNNIIRQLFGGIFLNQIISQQCQHQSERQQSFISISLEVKNNIYDSFKSFVNVDKLDGENKYYCQNCNKKVKASKIQSIKIFPPYLILCLKRFQFNFQIGTKIKINNYCQFSHKISLKEFSTSYLNPNDHIENKQLDGYNYMLKGVVVHTGSADSGHYYSFIQGKDGLWFEFNDQQVLPFDFNRLPQQAFGSKGNDDLKTKNAYMLIYQYENKNKNKKQQIKQNIISEQNEKIIKNIFKNNCQIQKYQIFFSNHYQQFIDYINRCYNQIIVNYYNNKFNQLWYQLFITHYLLITIRKQNFNRFLTISKYLLQLSISIQFTKIFLNFFKSCYFIQQFFIFNPNRQTCKILSQIYKILFIKILQNNVNQQQLILLQQTLITIQYMIQYHGQINQLTTSIKQIYKFLIITQNQHLQNFIIIQFDQLYLQIQLGIKIRSKIQSINQNKIKFNKNIFNFIEINDKKYNHHDRIQSWAIILLHLQYITNHSQEIELQRKLYKFKEIISKVTTLKIINIILECSNIRGITYLYKSFKIIKKVSKLLQGVQKALKDYQSSKYKPFLILLLVIINNDIDYHDNILTILQKVYIHNLKYYLQIQLLNQWIIRLVSSNQTFMQKFQNNKSFIHEILNWLDKNMTPTAQSLKKHKAYNIQKLSNRQYGILVSTQVKDYEKNHQVLKKAYQQILNKTFHQTCKFQYQEEPYVPDKIVQYFDSLKGYWVKATVISNYFGQITLKIDTTREVIWDDSQKIRINSNNEIKQLYLPLEEDMSDISCEMSAESGPT